jgi:diadenosine tetraphosphatase ApaH/serine/threonine PP2A family protein phosphatase
MRIALFADIHANEQAFRACLSQARERGTEGIVLLGDYVGYGADPSWALDTVVDLVVKGAVAVRGNHDDAINNPNEDMNEDAQIAIDWTRGVLSAAERRFLEALPLTGEADGRLYVHAEASSPECWFYVTNAARAARSLAATSAAITFCGHVHQPALYSIATSGKVTAFIPATGSPIQLIPSRRWLAVLGSVGQPRDRNPAAAYAMYDTDRQELTYCRTPYDVETAAARIRAQGLPAVHADRLFLGL